MKKRSRTILNLLLSALLIFSLAAFALNVRSSVHSRQEQKQAVQIAFRHIPEESAVPDEPVQKLPDDPHIKELLALDLDALRQENEDVIGWIHIPDTRISYPLLRGTDNAYYLSHTWQKTVNPAGSIFMDCQSSSDFSRFNTIIYGHNRMYEDMFGSLHNYRKAEYMQQHPSVYIANDAGVFRYDVFAAGFVELYSIVYGLNIESEQDREAFLSYALERSPEGLGLSPGIEDSFITLSTCTGGDNSKRIAVIAVLNAENSYEQAQ